MKLILATLLLTSCARTLIVKPRPNPNQLVLDCVIRLIGEHNIEAEKAQRVCESIYQAK